MVDDGRNLTVARPAPVAMLAGGLLRRGRLTLVAAACVCSVAVSGLVGTFSGAPAGKYAERLVAVTVEAPKALAVVPEPIKEVAGSARADAAIGWTLPQTVASAADIEQASKPVSKPEVPVSKPVVNRQLGAPSGPVGSLPYDEVTQAMLDMADGTITKVLSMMMIIMGLASGIVRQSISSVVIGLAGGMVLMNAPQVLSVLLGGAP